MTEIDPKTTSFDVMFAMLLAAQRANLASLEREVLLENEVALLKQKLFGRSSEKRTPKEKAPPAAPMEQVFDEATLDDEHQALDQAVTAVNSPEAKSTELPKNKRRRKP